ncbi:hypothetical protein A3K78_08205 [Candidatus Bathyarchaeota archaeon RBG_13_52_12]|nr:MAG: hypothetical protein A3K78_08205 [Candidatus Bathyarchaeota archaeon RBG_13_52_12]
MSKTSRAEEQPRVNEVAAGDSGDRLQTESLLPIHRKIIVACVPALNEERTIASIVLLARRHCDRVIVCDDGSADNTRQIAEEAGATVISNKRTLGKGASLRALFLTALSYDADVVVTLDGDGQHDPMEIPRLVKPIIDGSADMVIGSRYHRDAKNRAPIYRKVGLWILNTMQAGLKSNIRDTQSGYRAFSRNTLAELTNLKENGFGVESEEIMMAVSNGFRMVEVSIDVSYGSLVKTSTKNPFSHGFEVMLAILRLQLIGRPLRFLGVPGFIFCLIGIITGLLLLADYSGTRVFSVPYSLISFGFLIIGSLFILFAILVHAIKVNYRPASRARDDKPLLLRASLTLEKHSEAAHPPSLRLFTHSAFRTSRSLPLSMLLLFNAISSTFTALE